MVPISRNSLLTELEDAILRGNTEKRVETLRRVTDLFLAGSENYDEDQIALFDDVICRLAKAIEREAMVELSERLAPVDNAPPEIVRRLAGDEAIEVARPVLSMSLRLSDDDLIDIARVKGQPHLLAIAERPLLASAVTDVLIARGERPVLHAVARNEAARFSPTGYSSLIETAEGDEGLQMTLGQRRDLPPHLFRSLLARATEAVQKKLLAVANPKDAKEVQRVLAAVADRLGAAVMPRPRDYTLAKRYVDTLRDKGALNESQLASFARAGRLEEMLLALSYLTGVPLDICERLATGDRPDPVLILGKAAAFSWQTVRALIIARPGAAGTSTASLEKALAHFECLSPSTAQRVVRFWQVRQNATLPN